MAKALRDMATLQQRVEDAAQAQVRKTSIKIVQEAASKAPGSISGYIGFNEHPVGANIYAGGSELAAWIEWGTGDYAKEYVATLSQEEQAEALTFFINGKGKGHPQPYFFPAVYRNSPLLLANIEKELQKLANK